MARTPDYALGHYRGLVINVVAVTFVGFTSFVCFPFVILEVHAYTRSQFFLFPNTIPVNDNTMSMYHAKSFVFIEER